MADRDCEHCKAWDYDEKTGQVRKDMAGKPLPRPRHMKPPCSTCAKVPRSVKDSRHPSTITSDDAISPTPQTLDCIQHYRECRAVGRFPDDPIVRRMAALIREHEEQRQRAESAELQTLILTALSLRGGNRG